MERENMDHNNTYVDEDSEIFKFQPQERAPLAPDDKVARNWQEKFQNNTRLCKETKFVIDEKTRKVIITLPNVQLVPNLKNYKKVMEIIDELKKKVTELNQYSWQFALNQNYEVPDRSDFKFLVELFEGGLLTDNSRIKLYEYFRDNINNSKKKEDRDLRDKYLESSLNMSDGTREIKSNYSTRSRTYSAPKEEKLSIEQEIDDKRRNWIKDAKETEETNLIQSFMDFIKKLLGFGQIEEKEVRKILKNIDESSDRIGAICKQADSLKPKLQSYSAAIEIMGKEANRKEQLMKNLDELTKLYEQLENAKYFTKYRRELKRRAKVLKKNVKKLTDFRERYSFNPLLKVDHGVLRKFSKNYYKNIRDQVNYEYEEFQKEQNALEEECANKDVEKMTAKRATDIARARAKFNAKDIVVKSRL